MAQTADADHRHLVGGFDIKLDQRIENGNPPAKQGAGGIQVDTVRDGNDTVGGRTHLVGKAAMMADDGRLRVGHRL